MVNKEGDLMDIKIRLLMLGKRQTDLIEPLLTKYGIKSNSTELSAAFNPARGFQPKHKAIRKAADEILSGWEAQQQKTTQEVKA